jgi:hypothetical protein
MLSILFNQPYTLPLYTDAGIQYIPFHTSFEMPYHEIHRYEPVDDIHKITYPLLHQI